MHPNVSGLQTLHLADGRQLAFAEYGDLRGRALFFFHGGNDSRLQGELLAATAAALGMHLVAPDRPGYGHSDVQPGRTLLDWPLDVAQLADHLEIERFGVLGHSGGGPHAAACAYALPDRVTAAALVSSVGPPGSPSAGLGLPFRVVNGLMRVRALNRVMQRQTAKMIFSDTERWLAQWGQMSPADGALFRSTPEIGPAVAAEMQEGLRQGVEHVVWEHALYKQDWGFALSEICMPVSVWHGRVDRQAAPGGSRYLAAQIPGSTLHMVEGEGHLSVLYNSQREILEEL